MIDPKMNIEKTIACLQKLGIPERLYAIGHVGHGDNFCLTCNHQPGSGDTPDALPGQGWEVAYSERGYRWDIQQCATEADACRYLIACLVKWKEDGDIA